MPRKNMQSIVTALAPMASTLPTQRPQVAPEGQGRAQVAPAPPPAPAATLAPPPQVAAAPPEPVVQFSFSLRKSQRKQLARLADDVDLTMRAFILEALRERGLEVKEDDLRDLRQGRG